MHKQVGKASGWERGCAIRARKENMTHVLLLNTVHNGCALENAIQKPGVHSGQGSQQYPHLGVHHTSNVDCTYLPTSAP
eukprot:scaffold12809_cov17-Tisochrysis_lutea.AAC.1